MGREGGHGGVGGLKRYMLDDMKEGNGVVFVLVL